MTVLDSYIAGSDLALTIYAIWDGAGLTAQTVKAICGSAATLSFLTLKIGKVGAPQATLRYDVYNSAMTLVDWSATFSSVSLTTTKTNKTLALTQNYVCALNEVLWVGCRCTAAKLINQATDYIVLNMDMVGPRASNQRDTATWQFYPYYTLRFILEGVVLRRLLVAVGL